MGTMASQIISLTIVYSTIYSGVDQRKHQSSASLAFVRGIHRWPMNSPHKEPVTRRNFPFDDVIMFRDFFFVFHLKCDYWAFCLAASQRWRLLPGHFRNRNCSVGRYGSGDGVEGRVLRTRLLHWTLFHRIMSVLNHNCLDGGLVFNWKRIIWYKPISNNSVTHITALSELA